MFRLSLAGILLLCELIAFWQVIQLKKVKPGNILFSVELPAVRLDAEETNAVKENYKKDTVLCLIIAVIIDIIFYLAPVSSMNVVITFLVIAFALCILMYIPFIIANKRMRTLKREKRWFVKSEAEDEDKCWIGGLIYFNRKDPSVRVISRFNGKKTFNLASKRGGSFAAALGVLFILAIGCVFFYVGYEESITPALIFSDDGTIEVDSTYGQTFNASEIVNVSLVDSVPVTLRTFGTATENLSRGKFNVTDCPNSTLYIYNNVKPYIKIQLEDGYIFFNCRTASETADVYNKLLDVMRRGSAA